MLARLTEAVMAEPARREATYADIEAVPVSLVAELLYGSLVTAWIETPPDRVCEVLSPSTEAWNRGAKRQIYAEAAVPHLWFVNPALRELEAFQLPGAAWMLSGVVNDVKDVRLPPFEAAPFSLGLLWPFDEPNELGTPSQT
jgi:Uma2 family endonuclease